MTTWIYTGKGSGGVEPRVLRHQTSKIGRLTADWLEAKEEDEEARFEEKV